MPKILHLDLADVVDRDRKHDDLRANKKMFESNLSDRLAAKVHEDTLLKLNVVPALLKLTQTGIGLDAANEAGTKHVVHLK